MIRAGAGQYVSQDGRAPERATRSGAFAAARNSLARCKHRAEGALAGAAPVLGRIARIVMEFHGREYLRACERQLARHGFRKVLEAESHDAFFLCSAVQP